MERLGEARRRVEPPDPGMTCAYEALLCVYA